MDDCSTRAILITLRAELPTTGVEVVVQAARYEFDTGVLVSELTDAGRVDDIVPLIHVWLQAFVDGGDSKAGS